tara:strand:+ start:4808 stop:6958 length:2151 start_codon:yes stop_codon:yes gene_type:complete
MDIIEIRLENGSLDLFPKSMKSFYVNKANHNLANLESREASNSKTISIPLTPNNISLIGSELPSLASSVPSTSYNFIDCEVLMYGLPIMKDASILVGSESNKNTVSITVFSEQAPLFDSFSEDSIRDLDWSAYNVEWKRTSLAPYLNTTEGMLFGNAVWSDNTSFNNAISKGMNELDSKISEIDVNSAGAWLYIKTIFNKILAKSSEFTFDTSLIENDTFNNLVLGVPVTKKYDNTKELKSNQGRRTSTNEVSGNNAWADGSIPLAFPVVEVDSPVGFWDETNKWYEVTADGFYEINLRLYIAATVVSGGAFTGVVGDVALFSRVGGAWQQVDTWTVEVSPVFRDTLDETYGAYLTEGEQLRIVYQTRNNGRTTYVTNTGYFNVSGGGIDLDRVVSLSDYIPDISQKDFMKEIFKMLHITINTLSDKNIQFDLWDNIPEAEEIDLTPYLDTGKESTQTGSLLSYARENNFKYTEDDSLVGEDFDYSMPLLNESLQQKKDVITSKFSASDTADNTIDVGRLSVPLFSYDYIIESTNNFRIDPDGLYITTSDSGLILGDVVLVNDGGVLYRYRIMVIENARRGRIDNTSAVVISNKVLTYIRYSKNEVKTKIGLASDGGGIIINDGAFANAYAESKNITFPDSLKWEGLVDSFYSNFRATISKPLVRTMWFRLPIDVFENLNFRRPVYVVDDRYYINNIQQYGTTQYCRIDLIRVQTA